MMCYKYLKILCVVCTTTMVCAQNMTTPATNTSTVITDLTTAETNASTSSNTVATNASTTGAPTTEATNASTAAARITETNVTTAASTTVTDEPDRTTVTDEPDRTTVTDETEGTTGMQNSTELPTDGIILTCGEDSMSVTIPKILLVDGVQGNDLMFQNSPSEHCYGEIRGDNVLVETSLTGCGTDRKENGTHEVYSNIVVNSETNDTISRQYKVEIPVDCSYSRSGHVGQAWYRLTDYILDKDLEEIGEYSFDLQLYDDIDFKVPIDGYPYVKLNDELYFAATLGSEEYSDLDLSIKSCKATDGEKYDSEPHYDLITNWIPQEEETTLACHNSTSPDNQDTIRVTTRALRFVELGDNHEMVYIHCELFVCEASNTESKCKEQCEDNNLSARHRRDVSLDPPPLPIQRLTRGPIRFRRAAPVPDELPRMQIREGGNPEMSTPITMWGLVAVVMGAVVIVLLAALVVTLRKLAATSKTAATRKNDEESVRLLDDEDSD